MVRIRDDAASIRSHTIAKLTATVPSKESAALPLRTVRTAVFKSSLPLRYRARVQQLFPDC